jgi:hypothetical protein
MADDVVQPIRALPQPLQLKDVYAVEFGGDTQTDVMQAAAQWVLQNSSSVHIKSLGWEDKAAHQEPGWSAYILTIYYHPD